MSSLRSSAPRSRCGSATSTRWCRATSRRRRRSSSTATSTRALTGDRAVPVVGRRPVSRWSSTGACKWIIDGYTTTDRYPYAQRAITDGGGGLSGQRFNYVRNSVKAVIDAYDGTTTLYIVDHDDPIVKAYSEGVPVACSRSPIRPRSSRAHFRYPEDMFRMQTNMWGRYHLDNPDAFYTNANAWSVAPDPGTQTQTGGDRRPTTATRTQQVPPSPTGRIPPYYLLMSLPGEEQQGFMLLRPFVPTQNDEPADDRVHGRQERPRALRRARDVPDAGQQPAAVTHAGREHDDVRSAGRRSADAARHARRWVARCCSAT